LFGSRRRHRHARRAGARGKPIDAVILGVFVTLSHTCGIVLVGVLASMGLAWLVAGQMEMYLALVVGILIIALALWMLFMQRHLLTLAMGQVITAMPAQTAPGGVDFPTMEQDHSQPLTTCIRMIMAMVTLMPTLTRIPMLTRMVMINCSSSRASVCGAGGNRWRSRGAQRPKHTDVRINIAEEQPRFEIFTMRHTGC
jgi:hypothetical protein